MSFIELENKPEYYARIAVSIIGVGNFGINAINKTKAGRYLRCEIRLR